MVDEDPGKSHHPLRDGMTVHATTADIETRRQEDKLLLVVKPELEVCFFRSMARVGLPVDIASSPSELRDLLNVPSPQRHLGFRESLVALHREARRRNIPAFITDLEDSVRRVL